MMENLLKEIREQFLVEQMDTGEYCKLKAKGMTFQIQQYYAKDFGNISVMSAVGFFGLMKMDTFIVNPTEKDMPLFSYDRIHAMGNDTLIIELYDTIVGKCDLEKVQKVKDVYADVPEHDLGEHWYDSIKLKESVSKKGKKAQTKKFDELTNEYFKAYMDGANHMVACDCASKREKAAVYVNGLLQNGGPSTDIFIKQFGLEKTTELFKKILFGV